MRSKDRRWAVVQAKPPCNSYSIVKTPLAIVSLSFTLLSAGCGTEFSSQARKPKSSPPPISKDFRNNKNTAVNIELVGLEAYRYQATITWPRETSSVSVFINKQFSFKADSENISSYTVGLDHNTEYLVTLYSQNNSTAKPIVVSETTIKTPLDVVLANEMAIPALEGQKTLQAHRVFLAKAIITEGKNLLVNTDELIADHSELATFKENQKAQTSEVGRDGGHLVIKAKKATGEIAFILRGEHGGDGKNGEPHTDRASRGPNGKDGYLITCDADERRCKTTCSPFPENGHPGLPGKIGNFGGSGRRGGSTGILQLEIGEVSPEFHFKIEKEIGLAGTPGVGGPGQQGGPGGLPGKFSEYCPATVGPDGTTGSKGPDGLRESNGIIQNDCVSIGEGFGRCS
jgi:hypothetical protein